jgi:hypothetical protein
MGKYISLAALCLLVTPAFAGEIGNLQAGSIEIGDFRGVVYYTSDHDGYRLVATIAQGETGLPVRFEATLMNDQKVMISVPSKPGEKSHVVEISRVGDKVVFGEPPASAADAEAGKIAIAGAAE